jgi:hypothetical protein
MQACYDEHMSKEKEESEKKETLRRPDALTDVNLNTHKTAPRCLHSPHSRKPKPTLNRTLTAVNLNPH